MVSVDKLRGLQLWFFFSFLPFLPSSSPCNATPRLTTPCSAGGRQERAKIKLFPVAPGVTRLFLCYFSVQLFSSASPRPITTALF